MKVIRVYISHGNKICQVIFCTSEIWTCEKKWKPFQWHICIRTNNASIVLQFIFCFCAIPRNAECNIMNVTKWWTWMQQTNICFAYTLYMAGKFLMSQLAQTIALDKELTGRNYAMIWGTGTVGKHSNLSTNKKIYSSSSKQTKKVKFDLMRNSKTAHLNNDSCQPFCTSPNCKKIVPLVVTNTVNIEPLAVLLSTTRVQSKVLYT